MNLKIFSKWVLLFFLILYYNSAYSDEKITPDIEAFISEYIKAKMNGREEKISSLIYPACKEYYTKRGLGNFLECTLSDPTYKKLKDFRKENLQIEILAPTIKRQAAIKNICEYLKLNNKDILMLKYTYKSEKFTFYCTLEIFHDKNKYYLLYPDILSQKKNGTYYINYGKLDSFTDSTDMDLPDNKNIKFKTYVPKLPLKIDNFSFKFEADEKFLLGDEGCKLLEKIVYSVLPLSNMDGYINTLTMMYSAKAQKYNDKKVAVAINAYIYDIELESLGGNKWELRIFLKDQSDLLPNPNKEW
ncbi:MAG: hypothetical protein UT30_C0032G0008 [Candidatus Uhrbacteria bacterium GW2011_GWF2_39_13]|uniref:Uncharacterized protein n=1 Tax=Candidatus Uhrbacteria bacterium GW2011_GWF2_39_13 TaxID=1618995 RepID=A0A0G0MH01_9BACT|nr:MAG: hypothetical protein UT30_C0032G0008 [Candidatus Uhrbacteria bacterium GW2011_GWF2_39_13]